VRGRRHRGWSEGRRRSRSLNDLTAAKFLVLAAGSSSALAGELQGNGAVDAQRGHSEHGVAAGARQAVPTVPKPRRSA
jgi:hypothetical protein